MKDMLEKNGEFGPSFEFPDLGPAWIGLVLWADSEVIGFFDGEHASRFVTPTEDVQAMPDVNKVLLNVIP